MRRRMSVTSIYEHVRNGVTAKQVAELYGLRVERNGRAFCPFHNDGEHAAMSFDKNGWCHCFVCNRNWDAIGLAAQILNLTRRSAAEQLIHDFHLDIAASNRTVPITQLRIRREREAKEQFNRRWSELCDIARECSDKLAQYTPETVDAEFDRLLSTMSKANDELDYMWATKELLEQNGVNRNEKP